MSSASLTLWQGNRLLGALHYRRAPGRQGDEVIDGVLLPAGDAEGLEGVMQVRVDIAPGSPVFLERLAPIDMSDDAPATTDRGSIAVPLRRMSDAEARGAPPALQFVVRDATGATLPTSLLLLQEIRTRSVVELADFGPLPSDAVGGGRLWRMMARVKPAPSPGEAPDVGQGVDEGR